LGEVKDNSFEGAKKNTFIENFSECVTKCSRLGETGLKRRIGLISDDKTIES